MKGWRGCHRDEPQTISDTDGTARLLPFSRQNDYARFRGQVMTLVGAGVPFLSCPILVFSRHLPHSVLCARTRNGSFRQCQVDHSHENACSSPVSARSLQRIQLTTTYVRKPTNCLI